VLVIIQGRLGDRPAGPEIRGWEMARQFAVRHDVTIAASVDAPGQRDGIPVVPRTRSRIFTEARRHDVVVAPVLPPYLISMLADRSYVRVADLYDPVELEIGTLGGAWGARRAVAGQLALRTLQMRWADIVVCANERQRERTLRDLGAARRRGAPPVVVTVPMGLPAPPPQSKVRPLRAHFAIAPEDPLVLWWGTVWRWLDAETAIRAIELLARKRPNVRFVITAGQPQNRATDPLNATKDAYRLAQSLRLLDRNVFFLDEWVPYEARHEYLGDAQVGLTLHNAGDEAPLAARARYTDYLWAALPSVLARGDELADDMAAAGAATLVPPHDAAAAADAIDRLLSNPSALAAARAACRGMAERYRWSSLIDPLVDAVDAMTPSSPPRRRQVAMARDGVGFYAQRLIDKCLGVS
jgi:glycosyltransferase involved in cell wall biosynthesis